MNFEEVLICLQDAEKCKDLVERLKTAGKHSRPFLNIRDALVELKMNKKPRGIEETTTMQHTFRYAEVDECFQKFRLVCKSWKNAVETMRFNRYVPYKYFDHINKIPVTYATKYLPAFRKIELRQMHLDRMSEDQRNLISNSMKKLNEIGFFGHRGSEVSPADFTMTKILQNSKTTLQTVTLPGLRIAKDIIFAKLRKFSLFVSEDTTSFQEFENYFPPFLEKHMENVEIVTLDIYEVEGKHVCEYVGANYPNHCISYSEDQDLCFNSQFEILPLKIVTIECDLMALENQKHTPTIEYLCFKDLSDYKEIRDTYGWNRFQDIFNQCTNLKVIELGYYWRQRIISDVLPWLPHETQQFWENVIAYLKKRGIHIAKHGEIYQNEKLRNQVAKEAKVSWRFHFQ